MPSLSSQHHQLSADKLIEFAFFQSEWDTNFATTNCPSHPDTFHITLDVCNVTRTIFAPVDGQADCVEVPEDDHLTQHYVPYVSEDCLCPIQLQRFMDATCVPPHFMSHVMGALWSFARQVVPVVTKDEHRVVVRPFTMFVNHVGLEYRHRVINQVEFSNSMSLLDDDDDDDDDVEEDEDVGTSEGYGFYKDCFEKVRFDRDIFEQSCSICFEVYGLGMDIRRLPCSHVYHGDCIVKWLTTKPTCPLCRSTIIE